MLASQKPTPVVPLTPDEVEQMPPALQAKLHAALAESAPIVRWVCLGAASVSDSQLVERMLRTVSTLSDAQRRHLSEQRIAALLTFCLEDETRAETDLDLERDNARLRAAYLKTTPTYTAAEIRSFQTTPPKNPSDPAARWKRERRVFAVPYGNSDLFPAFQFVDGIPHPHLKKILKRLPAAMSPWQIALWFASANGWLDAKTPAECLNAPDAVLGAAEQLNEPAVG